MLTSALVVFVFFAASQDVPAVVIKNPPGSETKDLPINALPSNLEPKEVFCCMEGVLPLSQPVADAGPSGHPKLKFGEGFTYVDTFQSKETTYFLLTKGVVTNQKTFRYIGWVSQNSLLTNDNCLRDPDTLIQRKALIIVNRQNLAGKKDLGDIRPLKNPNDQNSVGNPIKYYSIMYIFKIYSNKAGEEFALLGFSANFQPKSTENSINRNDFLSVIIGWVAVNSLYQWNTREALQWDADITATKLGENRRQPEGKIFKTKEDALKFAATGQIPNADAVIFTEIKGANNESLPWPKDKPRYPIFAKPEIHDEKAGRLFHIGVIGDFVNDKGEVVKADDILEVRKKMDAIENELVYSEILLVIDATQSMDKYLNEAVPDWIEKIIAEVKKKANQKVRICASIYRDIDNEGERKAATSLDSAVTFYPWEEIGAQANSKIIGRLKSEKAEGGADPREQFVHGLRLGLERASEDAKRHSHKLVVLIGDMGNHTADNGLQNLQEEYKRIAQLMAVENGSPWEFLAIQVPNPNPGNNKDYQLFKEQCQAITSEIKVKLDEQNAALQESLKNSKGAIRFSSDDVSLKFVNRDTLPALIETMQERYEASEKKLLNLRKEARALALGLNGGAAVSPAMERILAQENINTNMLRENGSQIFIDGWVWENDLIKKNQIKIMVLLNSGEVQKLYSTLEPLKETYTSEDLRKWFTNRLQDLQTGDLPSPLSDRFTANELIVKRELGLSLNSKLFTTNQEKIAKEKDLPTELSKLRKKILLIGDIRAEIERKYINETITTNSGLIIENWKSIGDPVKTNRFHSVPGGDGTRYIWIDGEKEFP